MIIQVKKLPDGKIELMKPGGREIGVLTKEQARSLADVLIAATNEPSQR